MRRLDPGLRETSRDLQISGTWRLREELVPLIIVFGKEEAPDRPTWGEWKVI